MDNLKFYCPLYDGKITAYDCDKISCAARYGYLPNDGLPPILPLKVIVSKKNVCLKCSEERQNGRTQ